MNKNIITTIKKELRATLRDKKSLLMMLLTPFMIPLFIFMFSFIYDTLLNDVSKPIYNIGINYKLNDTEKEIVNNLEFETKYYKNDSDLKEAYKNNNIIAYIIKDDNNYTVYSNNSSEDGASSTSLIMTYLDTYNIYLGQSYLSGINADMDKVYNNITYKTEELTGSNDFVNQIITTGFIFAIMAITLTAIYSATDSTAGEKEKGTLETFLTFPIRSEELIMGKYLSITFSCFITSIISTILAVVSLIISKDMFTIFDKAIMNFNFTTIAIGLLIMLAFSLFISGLCIAIASLSKTYKEAQSALTPISLLTMIPMFLDILKINLTPVLSMVPMINHTMLLKTVFCGTLGSSDIINILIMFVSTIVYSFIIIKLISRQYKSEKVLFSI